MHAAMWARSRGEKVAWVGGAQAYSLEVLFARTGVSTAVSVSTNVACGSCFLFCCFLLLWVPRKR